MSTYRTDGHWRNGIARDPHPDAVEPCTNDGDHPGHALCAQLVAVVINGDPELADRICALLNREETSDIVIAYPRTEGRGYPAVPDSCTCTIAGPDPACPVHQGRKARAPRPPYLGPGCICDGSGRTCPRHGVVP